MSAASKAKKQRPFKSFKEPSFSTIKPMPVKEAYNYSISRYNDYIASQPQFLSRRRQAPKRTQWSAPLKSDPGEAVWTKSFARIRAEKLAEVAVEDSMASVSETGEWEE